MEMQTNIFDFLDDKELTIYDKCLVPGIKFMDLANAEVKKHSGKRIVVDAETGKRLFMASIEHDEDDPSTLYFSYQSLDNYWGGGYPTKDIGEIKQDLFKVSNEIREEG